MAIFGLKKRNENKPEPSKTAIVKAAPAKMKIPKASVKKVRKASPAFNAGVGTNSSAAHSIIRPRITEKSGILSQNGVYTFEVSKSANKQMVAAAIKSLYKVTPVKIGMINQQAKNVFVKGRKGTVAGFKKAVVTVKSGEKIDFV